MYGQDDEQEIEDAACVVDQNPGRALAGDLAKRDKTHEANVRKHRRKWEANEGNYRATTATKG